MFGYVKVYKPELKMKDFDTYKGIYCSLCRRLGRDYGLLARFTLNYDFTLLALTRLAFAPECCGFEKKRCTFNPAKKCLNCVGGGDELGFAAAAAMIMCYFKIIDNISDGRFFRRLAARMLKPYFALKHKKAKRLFPQLDEAILQAMSLQSEVEKRGDAGIDASAHPSARAMGSLLSMGFDGQKAQQLERFGYLVGRWVYLADALDDMEDDEKTGSYNVFNKKENTFEEKRSQAVGVLNLTAAQLTKEYGLLKPPRFGAILENIVFDGLYASMNEIMKEIQHERSV